MRWVKFLISITFTAALVVALSFPIGPVPFALGGFFSPFSGFWKNAVALAVDSEEMRLDLPGLKGEVNVAFDDRGVPHIFADNKEDMWMVQGYLHAQDRLWQMEFQTLAAAGRLTEVVGRGNDDRILKYCKGQRRKGLTWAAERAEQKAMAHPEASAALRSYTTGVNAYISNLRAEDYPIEYKILNYKPEPWSPKKTLLIFAYMGDDLAGHAADIQHSNALQLWGREIFDKLYPEFPDKFDPIVPRGTRFDRSIKLPQPRLKKPFYPDSLVLAYGGVSADPDPIGSNNWVVSGKRSSTGKPILANDPHLGLNLPAIWYENQLSSPNTNVYGVSIPGVPGVLIGFNDSIAWGETNASQDVMDFYKITFRDDRREEYLFDGQWLPAKTRVETFVMPDGEKVQDPVIYTHLGPVMYDRNYGDAAVPMAVRWTLHDAGNEILTFLRLNRANNYEDYLEALSTYAVPGQNFVFASASGDIALWHQGRYYNKWWEQGRFVMDGSRRDLMWADPIPQDQIPHVVNPEQGFIQSANQRPTDYRFPYYYTGTFAPYRARRIQELLQQTEQASVADMKSFQLDTYNKSAEDLLPLMLTELDTTSFNRSALNIFHELRDWDYTYPRGSRPPGYFEYWYRELRSLIWDDEFQEKGVSLRYPSRQTTIDILNANEEFPFYTNQNTGEKLSRQELIQQSYMRMVRKINEEMPTLADRSWGEVKGTDFLHLARVFQPFNRRGLVTDGSAQSLNAINQRHGPSWRMIVALGDKPEAYGIYPGGQSGNPASPDYDAFLDDWREGRYYSLWLMEAVGDSSRPLRWRQRFSPGTD